MKKEPITNTLGAGKTLRQCLVYQYSLSGDYLRGWASVNEVIEYYKCRPSWFIRALRWGKVFANSQWSLKPYAQLRPVHAWWLPIPVYTDDDKNPYLGCSSLKQAVKMLNLKKGNAGTLSRAIRKDGKAFSREWARLYPLKSKG